VTVDVSADGHDEFFQVAENASAKPILSEVAKEAFHHVEPGRAGGSEVQMKARMSLQPALDLGVLVGGIVIADQVKRSIHRDGVVDQAEGPRP